MSGYAKDAEHYKILSLQPIQIMRKLFTKEMFYGFLLGNIIKYALRCGHKDDPVKEIEKVLQYSKWYLNAVNEEPLEGVDAPRISR